MEKKLKYSKGKPMKILIGSEFELQTLLLNAKKEVFDDIEKKWLYKQDKKIHGQRFVITIGETRWKELKEKHNKKD